LLMVAQLIVAQAPWNLPAWWQLRRLRFAIEVDCDARVLQTSIDPVSYGEAFVAIAQYRSRPPLGAVALTEPVSQLERRIKVMLSNTPRFYPLLAGGCAALAMTFVVYAAQLQAPVAAAQGPAALSTADFAADTQKPAPGAPSGAKFDRALPGVLALRGKPATFSYTPSSEAVAVRGTADSIVFGDRDHEVTLTGNASLTQGDSTVAGDRLEYRPREIQ
jgi:hypothetical protein